MPNISPVLMAYIQGEQERRAAEESKFGMAAKTEEQKLRRQQFENEQKEFEKRLEMDRERMQYEHEVQQAQAALTHHQIRQAIQMGAGQGMYPEENRQLQQQQEMQQLPLKLGVTQSVQAPEGMQGYTPTATEQYGVGPTVNKPAGVDIEGEHFTSLPSPESLSAARRTLMQPEIEAKIQEAGGVAGAVAPYKMAEIYGKGVTAQQLEERKAVNARLLEGIRSASRERTATISAGARLGAANIGAEARKEAAKIRNQAESPENDVSIIQKVEDGLLATDKISTKTRERIAPQLSGTYTQKEAEDLAKYGGTIGALDQLEEIANTLKAKHPLPSSGLAGMGGTVREGAIRLKDNDLWKRIQSINIKMPELGRSLGVNRWSVPEQKIFEKGTISAQNSDAENLQRINDLKDLLTEKMRQSAPTASDAQIAKMVARHAPKSIGNSNKIYKDIVHNGKTYKTVSTDGGITFNEITQ